MTAGHAFDPRFARLVAIGLALAPASAFAQSMGPGMPMPTSMSAPVAKPTPTPPRETKPGQRAHHNAVQLDPLAMPLNAMDGIYMDAMPGMTEAPSMSAVPPAHGDDTTLPRTPIPVPTAADRAGAIPPAHDHPAHDNGIQHTVLVDRLETSNAGDSLAWNGRAWIGSDMNRLWLRSEGLRVDGRTGPADLEVLAGHSIAPWWDVVAGLRHDFSPGGAQDFAAIGVQGVAPGKIAVDATAYVGQGGQTAARLDVEYESLLTNRLILQPHVELNLFGRDDPDRGIGSGLGTVDVGLRLRYEITRRFAPYIGVEHQRAFGTTARLRRDNGDHGRDTRIVAGVRWWF